MLMCEMLARYVRDAGVTTQFGLLGEGNIAVATALQELGVRFVPARREDGAVGMADGWARRTGGVGFVSVTQGPGLTNTVTSLTEAARHGTSLVLLTGVTPAAALHNPQRFPAEQLVGLTGAGWRQVRDVSTVADDVRAVFAGALQEQRPYVLGVDADMLYQVVDDQLFNDVLPETLSVDWRAHASPAVVPSVAAVAAAVEVIKTARRPVIIVGRGARGHTKQIESLAEQLGAPIATSLLGKGLVTGSRHHIGVCGGFATAQGADRINSADVIVAFGCSLNPWTATELIEGSRVVHIDTDPSALGRWRVPEVAVLGDAGIAATAIREELRKSEVRAPSVDLSTFAFDTTLEQREDSPKDDAARSLFQVSDVALAVREMFPSTAVLSADTGQATADIISYVDVHGSDKFIYTIHAGSIGLGLGAAIGAASASTGEWVVHFTGDGSLMMSLQELATVSEQGSRMAIVVLDDNGYGAEALYTQGRGLPSHLAAVPHPDLDAVAHAFGLGYRKVEELSDLQAIRALAEQNGPPTIFHVLLAPGSASRFFRDYSTVEKIPSWSAGE